MKGFMTNTLMILNSNWYTRSSDERGTIALVTCAILQCPLQRQGPWIIKQAAS